MEKLLITTIFSVFPKTNFCFSVMFIMSSASAFNLDQSKNLSFSKELKTVLSFYSLFICHCKYVEYLCLEFCYLVKH